jgi:hypothetical protein
VPGSSLAAESEFARRFAPTFAVYSAEFHVSLLRRCISVILRVAKQPIGTFCQEGQHREHGPESVSKDFHCVTLYLNMRVWFIRGAYGLPYNNAKPPCRAPCVPSALEAFSKQSHNFMGCQCLEGERKIHMTARKSKTHY